MDNAQCEPSLSEINDANRNDDPSEKDAAMKSMDEETSEQILLGKIAVYKMMHENECEDGKAMMSEAMMECLNEIKTLFDILDYSTSL